MTFAAFDAQPDTGRSRRLLSSTGAALFFYGAGALALFFFLRGRPEAPQEKQIDVLFQPPPPAAEPEPPPPPPPPPRPAPKAPVVEAPPAEAPPPVAPRSTTGPTGGTSGIDVGRTGGGDPTRAEPVREPEPAAPAPVTPPPVKAGPMNLPEDADPPEPDDGNEQPEYPADARAAGIQMVVILKIVIDEHGNVTRVDVLKGDEPFVASAVAAVKKWHYTPAQLEGKALSVFKIVKVTFKP